jgi:hypothetical protein
MARKKASQPRSPDNKSKLHWLDKLKVPVVSRLNAFLARRPHRSFRMTKRRDYARSLKLPGYWSFTFIVLSVLRQHRRMMLGLVIGYGVATALFVGLSSQDAYGQLSQLLDQTSADIFTGGWGAIGQAGLLIFTGLSGSLSPQLTEAQQIFATLILLLTWLTTVWLLRANFAGQKPLLRDGLYNAGAPIVPTALISLILLLQLLPATIGIILLNSAASTNLLESGFIAMIVSMGVILLMVLTAYWAVATTFALIVVTLPGMYPLRAMKVAGDMVVGRRIRLMLRIIWMLVCSLIAWVAVVLPAVLLDRAVLSTIPFIQAVPFVPIVIALVSAAIVVWTATYMYVLYRKVVEDDASPA